MENGLINSFDGEYAFLSNFYMCSVVYNGITYMHSEGAFQAQKSLDEEVRKMIADIESPGKAKRAGKSAKLITLRDDWEEVKDQVMEDILRAKFTQHPDLKEKLLATGDAELVEGNNWHDNYWGNCSCVECASKFGKNHLGKALMKLRDELRTV